MENAKITVEYDAILVLLAKVRTTKLTVVVQIC